MERNLVDMIAIEMELDVEVVAAQWIMANGMMTRIVERAVIAGLLVVIEDDLLIERFGVHLGKNLLHGPKACDKCIHLSHCIVKRK